MSIQVYDAAVAWLKHDAHNRIPHKTQVLQLIRFPLITKRYLTSQVHEEPLLQDCCDCLKMIIGKVISFVIQNAMQALAH